MSPLSVEIVFGGWGDPQLPEDFTEIKDYLVALAVDEPIPSWLIEMIDVLVEFKELATNERLKYRMSSWSMCTFFNLILK